jgi:hypothetical protein
MDQERLNLPKDFEIENSACSCYMEKCCCCFSLRNGAFALISFIILNDIASVILSSTSSLKYQWLMILPGCLFLLVNIGGLYGVYKKQFILVRNSAVLNLFVMLLTFGICAFSVKPFFSDAYMDECANDKLADKTADDINQAKEKCRLLTYVGVSVVGFFAVVIAIFNFYFSLVLFSYSRQLRREQEHRYTILP